GLPAQHFRQDQFLGRRRAAFRDAGGNQPIRKDEGSLFGTHSSSLLTSCSVYLASLMAITTERAASCSSLASVRPWLCTRLAKMVADICATTDSLCCRFRNCSAMAASLFSIQWFHAQPLYPHPAVRIAGHQTLPVERDDMQARRRLLQA